MTALRESRYEPLRLVNAPTTACIGYSLDRELTESDERLLLVLDGDVARSSYSDISLLLLDQGVFEVLNAQRVTSVTADAHLTDVVAVIATLIAAAPAESLPATVRQFRQPIRNEANMDDAPASDCLHWTRASG